MSTSHLLSRFANEPCLVSHERAAQFESCLRAADDACLRLEAFEANEAPRMQDDFWPEPDSWLAAYRPYVVVDGVLQIPVKGVLLNDFAYALGTWATGYDYIWRAFKRGMEDENVKGIALICNTPGGMVAGNFDLVDKMYALRGTKPVAGFAAESAYSAGYSIISVADPGQIHVTRTGGVGSIGVVTTHVDMSKLMDDIGYGITFIFAGAHKVDGNPYEPLPDAVKADIQERIDALYSIFVALVARNRGLSEDAVRATEARCFMAPQALSNGLADTIGSLDDSLADFSASLIPQQGELPMAESTQAETPNPVDTDAIRAEAETQGHAAGLVEGTAQGATAERDRIAAILNSDVASKRPAAARMLAFDTDKDADSAIAALGKLPEEQSSSSQTSAGAPKGMFAAAMSGSDNPDLGENGEDDTDAQTDGRDAVALFRSIGLAGFGASSNPQTGA